MIESVNRVIYRLKKDRNLSVSAMIAAAIIGLQLANILTLQYTQELMKTKDPINQVHRCIFFGGKAEMIVKFASTGRHIHLRGSLRSQAKGEGQDRRYYTSILVEEFKLSPRQSVEALKDTLREIIDENNITEYNQFGILADDDTNKE